MHMVKLLVRKESKGQLECIFCLECGISDTIAEITDRAASAYDKLKYCFDIIKSTELEMTNSDCNPGSPTSAPNSARIDCCVAPVDLGPMHTFKSRLMYSTDHPVTESDIIQAMNFLNCQSACAAISSSNAHIYNLWWAGRSLNKCSEKQLLREWFGTNEKSTITVVLSPDPPQNGGKSVDGETYKNMVAFYHKRDQELKRLNEDNDDSYLESLWTDPRELKQALNGLGTIKFKSAF